MTVSFGGPLNQQFENFNYREKELDVLKDRDQGPKANKQKTEQTGMTQEIKLIDFWYFLDLIPIQPIMRLSCVFSGTQLDTGTVSFNILYYFDDANFEGFLLLIVPAK